MHLIVPTHFPIFSNCFFSSFNLSTKLSTQLFHTIFWHNFPAKFLNLILRTGFPHNFQPKMPPTSLTQVFLTFFWTPFSTKIYDLIFLPTTYETNLHTLVWHKINITKFVSSLLPLFCHTLWTLQFFYIWIFTVSCILLYCILSLSNSSVLLSLSNSSAINTEKGGVGGYGGWKRKFLYIWDTESLKLWKS